jgi:hypothetical protein
VLATRDGTRPGRSLQARCDPGRARARHSTSSGRRLLDVLLIRFSVLSQLHACKSRLFADGMPTLARKQGVSSDPDHCASSTLWHLDPIQLPYRLMKRATMRSVAYRLARILGARIYRNRSLPLAGDTRAINSLGPLRWPPRPDAPRPASRLPQSCASPLPDGSPPSAGLSRDRRRCSCSAGRRARRS